MKPYLGSLMIRMGFSSGDRLTSRRLKLSATQMLPSGCLRHIMGTKISFGCRDNLFPFISQNRTGSASHGVDSAIAVGQRAFGSGWQAAPCSAQVPDRQGGSNTKTAFNPGHRYGRPGLRGQRKYHAHQPVGLQPACRSVQASGHSKPRCVTRIYRRHKDARPVPIARSCGSLSMASLARSKDAKGTGASWLAAGKLTRRHIRIATTRLIGVSSKFATCRRCFANRTRRSRSLLVKKLGRTSALIKAGSPTFSQIELALPAASNHSGGPRSRQAFFRILIVALVGNVIGNMFCIMPHTPDKGRAAPRLPGQSEKIYPRFGCHTAVMQRPAGLIQNVNIQPVVVNRIARCPYDRIDALLLQIQLKHRMVTQCGSGSMIRASGSSGRSRPLRAI